MDKDYRILVLDDDKEWRGTHCDELARSGYRAIPTQFGEEAKEIIKRDNFFEIRAAIIDQILLDPKNRKLKQISQGEDVIKYIKSKRHDDFLLVMVTEAHIVQAENKKDVAKLLYSFRKKTGVEIFDKGVLKENYSELLNYLSNHIKPKPRITGNILFAIDVDQSTIYYVTDNPQKFQGNIEDFIEAVSSHSFELGLKKMREFLKRRRNVLKLKCKPNEQTFKLLQAVSERTLLREKPIFFTMQELEEILKKNDRYPDVKNRLWKIQEKIRKLAEIPYELYIFSKKKISDEYKVIYRVEELRGYEMKFNVINLYRNLQKAYFDD